MGGIASVVTGGLDNVLGTNISGHNAASEAADEQRKATASANALQKYMYDTTRKDLQPYREAGTGALSQMQDPSLQRSFTMSDFQQDPGYQYRLNEGMKAINNSMAARGMGNSGAALKALTQYGQDYATNEFTNAYNRYNEDRKTKYNMLSGLANLGSGSNASQVQSNNQYANTVGQNMIGAGNATASALISNGNRMSNLLNSAIGAGATYYGAQSGAAKAAGGVG